MKRTRMKIKKVTAQSQALKKVRELFGLSQSELALRLNISKTSVNHYENGWSAISESYINSFLDALDYPRHEWELLVNPCDSDASLRAACYESINNLEGEKLAALHKFLMSFTN